MKKNKLLKITLQFIICLIGMTSCLELPQTDSGDVGSVHWVYDFESEILTFSGTGEIVDGLTENNHDSNYYGTYSKYTNMTKGIIINEGITGIGEQAFIMFRDITYANISNSVTRIGDEAFRWCRSLTSISIPNSVISIGSYAFDGCELLTSVSISDGVATIGSNAFSDCWYLSSISIGKSVKNIGDYAFVRCERLINVTCYAVTPPAFDTFSPFDNPEKIDLYVPAQSVKIYKNNANWKNFKSISAIQ